MRKSGKSIGKIIKHLNLLYQKIKNFIAKIFGIKQCQCKDEHLELYEDVPEPEIPVHKAEKIKAKHKGSE